MTAPPQTRPLRLWAKAVARRRVAVLRRELERLQRRPDADAIHDVRVATRRLRAALRHLAPCFSETAVDRATAALRSLARLLGEARDIDIMLANVAGAGPGFDRLRRVLERRRQARLRRAIPAAARLSRRLPALERDLER